MVSRWLINLKGLDGLKVLDRLRMFDGLEVLGA